MEFLEFAHAWKNLASEEVVTLSGDPPTAMKILQFDYDEDRPAHRMLFGTRDGHVPEIDEVEILEVPRRCAGDVLERVLHKLHLSPLLVFPIGKWRNIFEVVSPVLLENASWMEIDTSATIELNTRDPLHFDLRELHTLTAVTNAILEHGETLEQGFSVTTTSAPVLVEIDPSCGVLITLGNESLAAEVRAVAEQVISGSDSN